VWGEGCGVLEFRIEGLGLKVEGTGGAAQPGDTFLVLPEYSLRGGAYRFDANKRLSLYLFLSFSLSF